MRWVSVMRHSVPRWIMMAVVLMCLGLVSCDSGGTVWPWSKTTMFELVGSPKALSPEHVQAYYVGFPKSGSLSELSVNALTAEATVELFRVRLEGPTAGLSERPTLILGEDTLYLHLADIDYVETRVYEDDSGGLRLDRGSASRQCVFRYQISSGSVDMLDARGMSRVLGAHPDSGGLILVGEDRRGHGTIGVWPGAEASLVVAARLDSAIGGESPLRIEADALNGKAYFAAIDGVYLVDITSGAVDRVIAKDLRRADIAAIACRSDGSIVLAYELIEPYDPEPILRKGSVYFELYDAEFELVDRQLIPGHADYVTRGQNGMLVAATIPNGDVGWVIDSRYVSFDGLEVHALDPYLIDEQVFDAHYSALYQRVTSDDFPHRIALDTVTLPVWSLAPGEDEYLMIEPHSGELIKRYRP